MTRFTYGISCKQPQASTLSWLGWNIMLIPFSMWLTPSPRRDRFLVGREMSCASGYVSPRLCAHRVCGRTTALRIPTPAMYICRMFPNLTYCTASSASHTSPARFVARRLWLPTRSLSQSYSHCTLFAGFSLTSVV